MKRLGIVADKGRLLEGGDGLLRVFMETGLALLYEGAVGDVRRGRVQQQLKVLD